MKREKLQKELNLLLEKRIEEQKIKQKIDQEKKEKEFYMNCGIVFLSTTFGTFCISLVFFVPLIVSNPYIPFLHVGVPFIILYFILLLLSCAAVFCSE